MTAIVYDCPDDKPFQRRLGDVGNRSRAGRREKETACSLSTWFFTPELTRGGPTFPSSNGIAHHAVAITELSHCLRYSSQRWLVPDGCRTEQSKRASRAQHIIDEADRLSLFHGCAAIFRQAHRQ
jgi:hypothetical protein